jgi:glycine/D-amino acid oxidase-like deaminating enzyme
LSGNHSCDIAIVGGGVTGCAAAHFFATAGADVLLVERARIGRGSTAASTALLMQEPDNDLAELVQRYGLRTAERMWRYSQDAVRDMRKTLVALRAARVHQLPSVYFARRANDVEKLRREFETRRRARLHARWLEEARTRDVLGFTAPCAILTRGNAQVDPYGASLALARSAIRNGASLFEHSAARRITGTRCGVAIDLAHGTIRADWAVIATGYATPEFKPLAGRFRMMNTYVVATAALSAAERRAVGLGDVMLWDSGRPYRYARWTPDGRLLFGGEDRPAHGRTRRAALRSRTKHLWNELTELYPALRSRRAEYAWEGLFAITPDGLPYIGRHHRYPRHLFALGYGGNGMTFGFAAGRALVRVAQRGGDEIEELFGFSRMR